MREYGLEVRAANGDKRTVYFTPMSYIDWLTHADEEVMLESSSVRFLLAKYVTRVYDQSEAPVDPVDLLDLPPQTLASLIRSMIGKSGFSNPDEFEKLMIRLEYMSRTILGAYDYFIMVHLGPEIYLSMLEQDASVRANLVTQLERHTGIDVSVRFEESIRDGSPLDVVSDPDKYEKNKIKMRKGRPLNHTKTPLNNIPGVTRPQGTPPDDFSDLVNRAGQALNMQMAMDKSNKDAKEKRAFNWQKDNVDMFHEAQAHDQTMLNQDRQPRNR